MAGTPEGAEASLGGQVGAGPLGGAFPLGIFCLTLCF